MSSRPSLLRERRSAVSILFAASAVPLMGMLGLAVTVSFLTQAKQQAQLAADTAALNASKIAADWYVQNKSNWQSNAVTTGQDWFTAQIGSLRGASLNSPNVTVTQSGTAFNSSVTYSGSVPTYFAGVFGLRTLGFAGRSAATITVNAYLNLTLFIDNSSSMLIGATDADVSNLEYLTACSPMAGGSGQGTGAYTGNPLPQPTCANTYLPTNKTVSSPGNYPVYGKAPNSASCGFACHWSDNNQVGAYLYGTTATQSGLTTAATSALQLTSYDYYYLAKNPLASGISGAVGTNLRLDVVYQAVANVISAMQTNQVFSGQYGVGVYQFNSSFTRVFPAAPSTAEASTDLAGGLSAALAIQTPKVSNNGDTDFPGGMTSLAGQLTNSGDGSSSDRPRKAVFIITDGIQDFGDRSVGNNMGPFSNTAAVNACNAIKAKGISIYFLYTPYARVLNNPFYKSNIDQYVVTPPNPSKIVQALNACAGSSNQVYQANSPSQITAGLTSLFQAARRTPARINS